MSSQVVVKPKMVSFRVRRKYFDVIVNQTKNIEFRAATSFWAKRLFDPVPEIAVFVCGKDVFRRRILKTEYLFRFEAANHLGREISGQEIKDLNLDVNQVFAVYLGDSLGLNKPSFYFKCFNVRREWENNQFGGITLFLCKRAGMKLCDVSICIRLKPSIKENVKSDGSRIIVDPSGKYTSPGKSQCIINGGT